MKRILVVLFASTLLLAACGGSDAADPPGTESGSNAPTDFNDADVAFAQGMIPHHEQAIEMADIAIENAGSEEVAALARQIKDAQDPEIETLQEWLADWGQSEMPSNDMGGMDHDSDATTGGGMSGGGMMSDQDMADLEAVTGPEFDKMFLEMMIEHHKGAIEMAKLEKADGQNPDAMDLAEEIIAAQEGEIAEMQTLLDSI